jgi:hypothetical protein
MTRPAIIVPRAGPCAAGRCPRGRHARLLRHGVSGVWRELTIFTPSNYLLTSLATTTHFGARRPRGGGMTTWWRPDLERIRAEIAAEAELEVEVKVEASDGDGANKGVKRKRAPPTKGPCEHGVKPRSQCKVCSGCPHGRRRSQCKECGGGSICEHGRQRHRCKECGGSQICEHGRIRSYCKECGGSQICEHGRKRSVCKECGGASICEHGRRRYRCKECPSARV